MAAPTNARRKHRSQSDSNPGVRARLHSRAPALRPRPGRPSGQHPAARGRPDAPRQRGIDRRRTGRPTRPRRRHRSHRLRPRPRAPRSRRGDPRDAPAAGSEGAHNRPRPPDRRCPHADTHAHGRSADGPRDRRPTTGRRGAGCRRRPTRRATPTHPGAGRPRTALGRRNAPGHRRHRQIPARGGTRPPRRGPPHRRGAVGHRILRPRQPCPHPAAGHHERATSASRRSPRAHRGGQSSVTPLGERSAGRRPPRRSRTRAAGRGARNPSQPAETWQTVPRSPATPCWPSAHRRNARASPATRGQHH